MEPMSTEVATPEVGPGKGISLDFSPYLNRHGHKPTGFGYWIFRVGSEDRVYSGLFSDALRQAKTHAKNQRQQRIKVLAGMI